MIRLTLAVCVLAATSIGADAQQPGELKERPTAFKRHDTLMVTGTVLAITKDAILMTREKMGPCTFPMHDCLAAGKVHKLVNDGNAYLLSDVKVGDNVSIDTIEENKQSFCVAIQIWERPGGLIPPSHNVNKKMPYHEIRNADIAFRDKGTPIPEHLKPVLPAVPKAK